MLFLTRLAKNSEYSYDYVPLARIQRTSLLPGDLKRVPRRKALEGPRQADQTSPLVPRGIAYTKYSNLNQSSDFLLISCIVHFLYFTNYFRVCIFVYLLTINFVRVLIVNCQNIVYSCITINFTISYIKIAHIYYIPCTCKFPYSTVYTTYFCYFILPVPVLFIPHF